MEKIGGNAASKANDATTASLFIANARATTSLVVFGLSGSNGKPPTVNIWQRKQYNTRSPVVLGKSQHKLVAKELLLPGQNFLGSFRNWSITAGWNPWTG